MTVVSEIRRAYKADEIDNVPWISSVNNPADGYMRPDHDKVLHQALRTGKLTHEIGEWIAKGSEKFTDTR